MPRRGGGGGGGEGALSRCSGREVQPGCLNPDLVEDKNLSDFATLFRTEFIFFVPCLRHITPHCTLCMVRMD